MRNCRIIFHRISQHFSSQGHVGNFQLKRKTHNPIGRRKATGEDCQPSTVSHDYSRGHSESYTMSDIHHGNPDRLTPSTLIWEPTITLRSVQQHKNTQTTSTLNYLPSKSLRSVELNSPLSSDHLIILIQFNVFRACLTNMSMLSIVSQFFTNIDLSPHLPYLPHQPSGGPPSSLATTSCQKSTRHPAWIDVFPLAAFRDNLVFASTAHNFREIEKEWCADMMGGLFRGCNSDSALYEEYSGLVVWETPWDVRGWEMSKGFVEKWGWLLSGCGEMVEATNSWRMIRGEEMLIIEV